MATKKKAEAEPKRVWAWGIKGSNGLIYAITMKESNAKAWREQGMDVRELVENDDK